MRWILLQRGSLDQLKHQMGLQPGDPCSALVVNKKGQHPAHPSSCTTVFLFRVSDGFLHKASFLLEPLDFKSHISRYNKTDVLFSYCKVPFNMWSYFPNSGLISVINFYT